MVSKRPQTSASLRPLRSSLSSCVKILTTREEKKTAEYMMKMTQAIHSRNFDVKRRVQTPASLRPLRGLLSSCLKILMTRVLVEEYYESCYRLTIMIEMRHCPHRSSAVVEGMKTVGCSCGFGNE